MIFNMTAPGGSSVSGWTDVSYTTDGSFSGNVLTDGHLCVISADTGDAMVDENSYIIHGLPLPQAPVYFTAFQGYYANITTLVVDTDGMLMAYDPNTVLYDTPFDGFTIIYPIAS